MAENAGSPARRAAPVVLVIEDDPDIGALLSDLLCDDGYAVRVVDTALGVRGEIERLHPVAIVLDLGLPYCSGAALLADLKADPVTAPIPVLVVSAYLECLSADRAALATTLIAKPFAPQDLRAALQAAASPGPTRAPSASAASALRKQPANRVRVDAPDLLAARPARPLARGSTTTQPRLHFAVNVVRHHLAPTNETPPCGR